MSTNTQSAGACQQETLALSGPDAARLCGISPRSWQRLNCTGNVPQAVQLGRRRVWPVRVLEMFLALGAPHRDDPKWLAALERLQGGAT